MTSEKIRSTGDLLELGPEFNGLKREELGRAVRDVWLYWASQQPDKERHSSWLLSWEQLGERDREVDRMIGAAIYLRTKALIDTEAQAEKEKAKRLADELHIALRRCSLTVGIDNACANLIIDVQKVIAELEAQKQTAEAKIHHCPKHGIEKCASVEGADHGCSSNDKYGHVWSKEAEAKAEQTAEEAT